MHGHVCVMGKLVLPCTDRGAVGSWQITSPLSLGPICQIGTLEQGTETRHKTNSEPRYEKNCFLHMRKQRRRSADQRLCFRYR